MRNFRLPQFFLLTALLLLSTQNAFSAVKKTPTVTRAFVQAVPCSYKNCDSQEQHGRLRLRFSDGRTQARGGANAYTNNEDAPQIAPDGKTLGWKTGEHIRRSTGFTFLPTRLVLYRDGRVLSTMKGRKYFIENWFFYKGSTQVALLSRGLHGPATCELHDARTGKLLATFPAPRSSEKNAPAWAKMLGE